MRGIYILLVCSTLLKQGLSRPPASEDQDDPQHSSSLPQTHSHSSHSFAELRLLQLTNHTYFHRDDKMRTGLEPLKKGFDGYPFDKSLHKFQPGSNQIHLSENYPQRANVHTSGHLYDQSAFKNNLDDSAYVIHMKDTEYNFNTVSRKILRKSQHSKKKQILQKYQSLSEEAGAVGSSLRTNLVMGQGSVNYRSLRKAPHGRHLLLISLLEDARHPIWTPRAKGKLKLYLPDSLKSSNQPNPPNGAIILQDMKSEGKVLNRQDVLAMLKEIPFLHLKQASRFNSTHTLAVKSLLSHALRLDSFDSTLSFLVTTKDYISPQIFMDLVLSVIELRDDVGFILPSFPSVEPFQYFPINSYIEFRNSSGNFGEHGDDVENHIHRGKRQAFFGGRMNQLQGAGGNNEWGGTWRINWGDGQYRTLPDSDPENRLWYFREDPMVNAHHLHWHLKMSNRDVPSWHPTFGLNMDRRGELFYFMHKQMLTRYNADRLSLDMPLTSSFSSNEWRQPIFPGYNSRLTESSGRRYPPRPHGGVLLNTDSLYRADNALRMAIQQMFVELPSGSGRLGYANGIDYGISLLGDAIEAFQESPTLGNIHNDGHEWIGRMHGIDDDLGVMGQPNGAVRDPLFFRWHKYIDDLFMLYKNSLPAYGDEELNFAGVEITDAHVQSERGEGFNNLYTYMDAANVRVQSVDLTASQSSVNIIYDRLNHVPFSYHINVRSQGSAQGLLRIFLIPANIRITEGSDVTQVAIEMDRLLIFMNPGDNYYVRNSTRSPFVTKASMPLGELQDRLLQGTVSAEDFSWSGCGWPQTMVLPRGKEGGMTFRLYLMVSKVLPGDSALTADWERMEFTSWSWCGVRQNEGDVPDSRPMGFPLDRVPPNGNWQSLMFNGNQRRTNHFTTDINIFHDPVGTTNSE